MNFYDDAKLYGFQTIGAAIGLTIGFTVGVALRLLDVVAFLIGFPVAIIRPRRGSSNNE